MSFHTYFRVSSYAMVAVATLALVFAGGLHPGLALVCAATMMVAWKLEGKRWQLSERVGLTIVLLSIPLFFLDWRYQRTIGESSEKIGVNALAHLIVFLSAIKLLQVKSDRDWVFLYLISFFQVLLAAGLSFSPIFLASFFLYALCALSTVIAFEIRKAGRAVKVVETRVLVPPDSRVFTRLAGSSGGGRSEAHRLPLVAISLLILILVLALPLFLVAPRAGSAIIAGNGAGLTTFIGFSENVTLGEIGVLKGNDEVVMHVRLEDAEARELPELRWRGVALDEFTGKSWKKSAEAAQATQQMNNRGFFPVGKTEAVHRLTKQTIFLEPIDSGVLFAAPRLLAIQGDFPFVNVDGEGAIQSRRHGQERIIYRALSDMIEPATDSLLKDVELYPAEFQRYLRLPQSLDPRIAELARAIIVNARARNRYEVAKAIESRLQKDYGYSLEMRAAGPDPLADFLFNIRSGHCEYFSTAMTVMLRTQGIAARVVNGFLPGEYNDAAGAYTVRQSDAHSWVEVYFPSAVSWVAFDPTPAGGRVEPVRTGLVVKLRKYAEAFELIWFQYVVGYDQQQQRSLATSLYIKFFDYRKSILGMFAELRRASPALLRRTLPLIPAVVLFSLLIVIALKARRFGWRRALRFGSGEREQSETAIVFYHRLLGLLAQRGIERAPDETPLEVATASGMEMPVRITHAYHRVRYGGEDLSRAERIEIEGWLQEMESSTTVNSK